MRGSATQDLTDGELFSIIENGIRLTGMPAWGTGTPEGERASWELVHFIRRLPSLSDETIGWMNGLLVDITPSTRLPPPLPRHPPRRNDGRPVRRQRRMLGDRLSERRLAPAARVRLRWASRTLGMPAHADCRRTRRPRTGAPV